MPTGIKIVNEVNLGRMVTRHQQQHQDPADSKLQQVWVYTTDDMGDMSKSFNTADTKLFDEHPSNVSKSNTMYINNNKMVTRSRSINQSNPANTGKTTIVTVNNKNWCGGSTILTFGAEFDDTKLETSSIDDISSHQPDFALIQEDECNDVSTDGLANSSGSWEQRSPAGSSSTSSGGRGGRRSFKKDDDEHLTPEEEERRRIRRERNKQAAARCRKRRVDQTQDLETQVEDWEAKKRQLQEEIGRLKAQQDELKFILDGHRSVCPSAHKIMRTSQQSFGGDIDNTSRSISMTPVAVSSHQIQQNHLPVTVSNTNTVTAVPLNIPRVVVKSENILTDEFVAVKSLPVVSTSVTTVPNHQQLVTGVQSGGFDNSNAIVMASTSLPQQFIEVANNATTTYTTLDTASFLTGHQNAVGGATNTTTVAAIPPRGGNKPARPLSLALKSNMMRSIEGIPIETPTNVVTNLNFDALMDGRTGLTPTNILTPVNMFNAVSQQSLNTPTGVMTPSCGSQQRSSAAQNGGNAAVAASGSGGLVLTPGIASFLADLNSPESGGPKLVSL